MPGVSVAPVVNVSAGGGGGGSRLPAPATPLAPSSPGPSSARGNPFGDPEPPEPEMVLDDDLFGESPPPTRPSRRGMPAARSSLSPPGAGEGSSPPLTPPFLPSPSARSGPLVTPLATPAPSLPPRPAANRTPRATLAPQVSAQPAELLTLDDDQPLGPALPARAPSEAPITLGPVASLNAEDDRALAQQVDASFLALLRDPSLPAAPPLAPFLEASEVDEVRALFEALSVLHARPIRDWMIDLHAGLKPNRAWVPYALGLLGPLVHAAAVLELRDVEAPLAEVVAALEEALVSLQAPGARTLEGPALERLLASYERLALAASGPFAIEAERATREAALIPALVQQVPGLHQAALQRLEHAGLLDARALFAASEGALRAAGLSPDLATVIVGRLQGYRHEVEELTPDGTRRQERARLEELVNRLAGHDEELQRASRAWDQGASEARRAARQAREVTLHQVVVALLRLGEGAEAQAIQKVPFAHALTRLRESVRALNERYGARSS